ncbi:hypothetical protein B7C42_01628 [Nocardia cerradoensis]|uniref:Uncharacterized protein n=1 Tax=Nocardia cerradoensis TaxID=85688 RepID=A0A231HCH6_9NOCA|nr:hypothetical protein [Nocardia cerradoensis]OXR46654.1 hypothetical protein B7C42_01628 [Nocardia cerradoensis]
MTERAPYDFEMPTLQPGDPVSWVDRRGVMHHDIVTDYREEPRGSGNYVLETGGLP